MNYLSVFISQLDIPQTDKTLFIQRVKLLEFADKKNR